MSWGAWWPDWSLWQWIAAGCAWIGLAVIVWCLFSINRWDEGDE